MIVHGGDVWQVGEELGIPPAELLDFSANINPRGLPARALERLQRDASDPRWLSLYPDPSARRLRRALSEQLAVPAEAIAVGPGAESLLAPILHCLRPRRALVPVPAFSEYRRVCAQWQIEFARFPLERAELFRVPVDRLCRSIEVERCGAVLLNNPHNPSGSMLDRREMLRIVEAGNSSGATLLLDEAFIDYAPHNSLVRQAAARPGLIALRSLTKFYGCPALRAGYAVAHPDTIRGIQSLLPTWPVTQLALDALAEAVADTAYAEASLRENALERERLAGSLAALGILVFPAAANYLFLELQAGMPAAAELRERLIARHRILIRNCDSYDGLAPGRCVRVAVRSAAENFRLTQAFADELRLP
jgi:threonine-phosphate decarboxylase